MIYYPNTSPSDSFLMILYPQRCDACQKQQQEILTGGGKGEGILFSSTFLIYMLFFQCYFVRKTPVNPTFITPRSFAVAA